MSLRERLGRGRPGAYHRAVSALPPRSPEVVAAPVPGDRVQEYLARLLVNAAVPQYRDRALDVASGRGYVLLELASRVGSVGRMVGIAEIDEARSAVQDWSALDGRRVEWYTMDSGRLEFPAASFTLVTCGMALPRLPDPLTALREMYRVLRPGGWVALTVPHPESGESLREALAQRMSGLPSLPAADHTPSLRWDERHLASLLNQAGFPTVHVQVVRQKAHYRDAAQWWQAGAEQASPYLPALGARLTQALQAWQSPADAPGFDVPLVTVVAIARRGTGMG